MKRDSAFVCFACSSVELTKSKSLITAIKTPYLSDGRFDLKVYDKMLEDQIEAGVEVCKGPSHQCSLNVAKWRRSPIFLLVGYLYRESEIPGSIPGEDLRSHRTR